MNEAVTKRFLLYFRLMLLVWILIVNAILHVVGFEYSWLIFLSNIMLFTDRKSTRLNSSHNRESRMPSSA